MIGIGHQPAQGRGERRGVARRDPQGIVAVGKQFGRTTRLRYDHRLRTRHRLDNGASKWLGLSAGMNDNVQGAINVCWIVLEGDEADVGFDVQCCGDAP